MTRLYLFICMNYTRRRLPKNALITFFQIGLELRFFQMPPLARSDKRQWDFFFLQKKAALAPGAWPKRKPRGGGSAVSKAALFVGKKNRPLRGAKRSLGGKSALSPPPAARNRGCT